MSLNGTAVGMPGWSSLAVTLTAGFAGVAGTPPSGAGVGLAPATPAPAEFWGALDLAIGSGFGFAGVGLGDSWKKRKYAPTPNSATATRPSTEPRISMLLLPAFF